MSRAAALALVLSASCARAPAAGSAGSADAAPAPPRHRVEDAPRALQAPIARAEAAVRTLRERIAARIAAELASGGVASAMKVCRREAPAIASAVSHQTGVELGRTGFRARDGSSAPRAWAASIMQETSARRAADVPAVVVDLGDRVGLLRPVALAQPCLACHGPPERVLPEVKGAADGTVPEDRAGGCSDGDLRGFYWAEARK